MAEINFQIDSAALQTIREVVPKANFDETKAALTEMVHPYTVMLVTEDTIDSAKADRAKVNKVKGTIDGYRKLVKAAYNEPYKKLEEKFKELTAVCDRGLQNIDIQLADFEERRKEEKRSFLEDYFQTVSEKMKYPEYLSLEDVLHPKWENKGTSLDECKKYIDERTAKIDMEVGAIRNLHSEWETALLNEYQRTLDFFAVVTLNEQLTQKAQQEAERKRKQQEEQARRQAELERQKQEAERAATEAVKEVRVASDNFEDALQKAIDADLVKTAKAITEPEYVGILKIYGTMQELQAVREFLDSHGFHYTLVSEKYALS